MKKYLVEKPEYIYNLYEKKAKEYFKILYSQLKSEAYIPKLIEDLEKFKSEHIYNSSVYSYLSKKILKPEKSDFNYIKWLEHRNLLEAYLNRSVSYIFLRDLGEDINSKNIQPKIDKLVRRLNNYLISLTKKGEINKSFLDISSMYLKAKEEKVETIIIWLIDKLKLVYENIPNEMDRDEAQRKIIKVVAGVVLNKLNETDDSMLKEDKSKIIEKAIKLGYYYGLTYPFIDDILDAKVLASDEEKKYTSLIKESIITGNVPSFNNWSGKNKNLVVYIQKELTEAFEYIKNNQDHTTIKSFFEKCYVFFNSQEIDRKREINNRFYTNEEIYTPIILKAYSSRVITRLIINKHVNEDFDDQMFFYGIYNQLADDFTDVFEDLERKSLTPYTYYIENYKKYDDMINPFELYFVVVFNLINNIYNSNNNIREIILCRVINGLKRFKKRLGNEKYEYIMGIVALNNKKLGDLVQTLVNNAENIEFFDKMLRDNIILNLKKEEKEKEEFKNIIKDLKVDINERLEIKDRKIENDRIFEAANYSLKGNAKRLRPIITWFIGINEYNLNKESMVPILRSLEYMHTASLIFDDLPSQDNSDSRRGIETLHRKYNIPTAELTALFLTQKAVEEQTLLNFDSKVIIKLINYSVKIAEDICKGQLMDLESRGKKLTLNDLNKLCFYKTGKAFEASIIMPSILANISDEEIEKLKEFSYHAGIAFQIKDDLLDVEGEEDLLGKATGKDNINKSATFVSTLGVETAKRELWNHYVVALDILKEIPHKTNFLKYLLDYIINRNK